MSGSERLGPSAAARLYNAEFLHGRTVTVNQGDHGFADDISMGIAMNVTARGGFAVVMQRDARHDSTLGLN